jgi:hypothetical protein
MSVKTVADIAHPPKNTLLNVKRPSNTFIFMAKAPSENLADAPDFLIVHGDPASM